MKPLHYCSLGFCLAVVGLGGCTHEPKMTPVPESVAWRIDNLDKVGSWKPEVLGAPTAEPTATGPALVFDGAHDGLIIPANAIVGWSQFTIEVLFNPAVDGAEAQRFFHIEDKAAPRRVLMEIRLTKDAQWSLDTFLIDGTSSKALNDPQRLHPAGRWYWVALRYDGQHLASFVNGAPEMEGDVKFGSMTGGQTSVGVRLNKVYWFKGAIGAVRFTPMALAKEKLQRINQP